MGSAIKPPKELVKENTLLLEVGLEGLIANRFCFNVEELLLNGDTASGDTYLAQLTGWKRKGSPRSALLAK
jgi:hypothetical protein